MKFSFTNNPLKTSPAWNLSVPLGLVNLFFAGLAVYWFLRDGNPALASGYMIFVMLIITFYWPVFMLITLALEYKFKWKWKYKFFTEYKVYNVIFYPAIIMNIIVTLYGAYIAFDFLFFEQS